MRPDETPATYARRLLQEHGPPPREVVEVVHRLQRQAAQRAA